MLRIIIKHAADWNEVKSPNGLSGEKWNDVKGDSSPNAVWWIGTLERLLFYFSFLVFPGSAHLVIGGWLAFKVTSKWEVWHNIIQVPKDPPDGVADFDWLIARRHWGGAVVQRFMIGTLLNVLLGLGAARLAKALIPFVS